MQVRGKYFYPILTAIMFPIALTGLIWGMHQLSNEQWLRGGEVEISADKAIGIARTACFSTLPTEHFNTRPNTYLKGDAWFVSIGRNAGVWQWHGGSTIVWAEVNAHNGMLTGCGQIGDTSGM